MRVLVTGQSGYVGREVVKVLRRRRHVVLDKLQEEPDAIIHLAWEGLPNYQSEHHFKNIAWQMEFLKEAVLSGVRNITVAGTCLETLPDPPNYAIAKLAIRALLSEILPETKWARLWYLYGGEQPEHCLLPRLSKAVGKFSVIDGERDFISVIDAALYIVLVAEQSISGIIDICSGTAESVESFCNRHTHNKLKIVKDYPTPDYELKSFHGNRERLEQIIESAN